MGGPSKRKEDDSRKNEEAARKKAQDPSFNMLQKLSADTSVANPGTSKSTAACDLPDAVDIKLITEGLKNEWFEARVIHRSDIRTFVGGRVFSVTLLDHTGSIRMAVFDSNKEFELLDGALQVNAVVRVERFRAAKSHPVYNKIGHPFETNVVPGSEINFVDDNGACPCIPINLIEFSKIAGLTSGTSFAEIADLKVTSGGELLVVKLVDIEGCVVDVNFWQGAATSFNTNRGSVLIVKNAKSKDYMGIVTLNAGSESSVWEESEIPEAKTLKAWYIKKINE